MPNLNQRIAALSPEKRALLEARLMKNTASANQTAFAPSRKSAELELSFSQQSLWFLDRLEPNSSFYSIPQAMKIVGPLNIAALQKAFETVVERHEVLRTQIGVVEGKPKPRLAQNICF